MSQTPSDVVGIPFSFFCSLLREISHIRPQKTQFRLSDLHIGPAYPARDVFRRWVAELRKAYSPIPFGTTAIVFKLLFPEEDYQRKYDIQESRLSRALSECFGASTTLRYWDAETASGCLGEEVKRLLEKTCARIGGYISPLSLAEVDKLLDQLASLSAYSDMSIRQKRLPNGETKRGLILRALFRGLSPIDASFLTQIIIKDLRPILYPIPESHYATTLLDYNSEAVKMLTKEHAMIEWDPTRWMLNSYRITSTIVEAATSFEQPQSERRPLVPRIGVPVTIPKSEKGRSPRHALSYFAKFKTVWAEVKYDGERAQIHVEIQDDCRPRITIFSKSRRDSTLDRIAVHDIIFESLGLTKHGRGKSRVKHSVILDAEMVACHRGQIDEFWRIRGLVEQTAYGVRGSRLNKVVVLHSQESFSQSSMVTEHSSDRHLALVFFDILALDSTSLVWTPYNQRREILESLINPIPGRIMFSDRYPINMSKGDDFAQITIEKIFSSVISAHQEGIVLKGEESDYHDDTPWVKLKRDYIPGYGDTIDLVVVGVGWDKARARELRVGSNTLTTFYIGGLANAKEIRRQPSLLPHFQVYFTVSYGLTRSQLEEVNFWIKNSDTVPYVPGKGAPPNLDYSFTLLAGLKPPTSILKTPLLAELVGAGFTKAPRSRNYELRFPRLTKLYREGERTWKDGVNLQELHEIACNSIGRDNSDKTARDISNELWGKSVSPGAKSLLKRKATRDLWEEKLAALDGRKRRQKTNNNFSLRTLQGSMSQSLLASKTSKMASLTAQLPPQCRQVGYSASHQEYTLAIESIKPSMPSTSINQGCERCASPNILPDVKAISRKPTPVPDPPASLSVVRTSQTKSQPRGAEFLSRSLLWFANPGAKDPVSVALKRSVPRDRRMHSLESLLFGCGWHTNVSELAWADQGIIFVDDRMDWRMDVVKVIEERFSSDRRKKTIYIFDVKAWSFDAENPERMALCSLR